MSFPADFATGLTRMWVSGGIIGIRTVVYLPDRFSPDMFHAVELITRQMS